MTFKARIAVLTGKTVRAACRVLHRGGTAKPGKIALKICPDLLAQLSEQVTCIAVTGTNGKTTCTRIIEEGLRREGLSCFANRSGANLIEGITTDFIVNSSLSGKCKADYAVLETDEAASMKVFQQLQPAVILVTNLFRDQVDRFGGVVNTRDDIRTGIKAAPNAVLVLNADCPVTSSLSEEVGNKAVFFGISSAASEKCGGKGISDLEECIRCGGKYEYDYITFSHLGGYRCPSCGSHRHAADYEALDILSQTLSGTRIRAAAEADGRSEELTLDINLPAVYNIYNALGSYAALLQAGVHREAAAEALAGFKCAFGRMEQLNVGKNGGRMILVKNDAGCNQVLQFLHRLEEDFVLSIYLNNNVSDGKDISWLENAEFELLNSCRVTKIYVSGMRTEEMFSRLIRAGIPESKIEKQTDCKELIRLLNRSEEPVFIMPTYTGMMEARAEIIRQCGGTEFWEG